MLTSKENLFELFSDKGEPNINEKVYEEWSCFLFYTSWFEELLFSESKHQCPTNDVKICMDLIIQIDICKFDYFGDYLSERYIDEEKRTNSFFNNLRLKGDAHTITRKALIAYKKSKTRDYNLLYAYLMVVYRYRNNMFHGNKGLINLNQYTEQINIINRFMHQLLKEIYRVQYHGYRSQDK